jgi:hypothetical protein
MSYQLYFYHPNEINLNEVIQYLEQKPQIEIVEKDQNTYFTYQNKKTQVYFNLVHLAQLNEEQQEQLNIPDFHFTGFFLVISYLKPSFFAYEAMELVTDLQNQFGLLIYDFHKEKEVVNYTKEELIDSWVSNNKAAVLELQAPIQPLEKQKSDYLWNYLFNEKNDDNQYPNLIVIQDRETFELKLAAIWEAGKTMIFPKADCFILKTTKKMLGLIKTKRMDLLSYDEVITANQELFKTHDEQLELLVLNSSEDDLIKRLPENQIFSYDELYFDEFVDVNPKEENEQNEC